MMNLLNPLAPYKLPIIGLSIAITIGGAYMKGRSDADTKWKVKVAAAEQVIKQKEALNDSLAVYIQRDTENKVLLEKAWKSAARATEINAHKKDFDKIVIPKAAIRLHNTSTVR